MSGAHYGLLSVCKLYWCCNHYSLVKALTENLQNDDTIPIKCEFLYFTAHCLSKETGKKSIMGIFEWQLTVIGGTSSPVSCPYGPPAANATRPCGGNFTTGGMWKSPDVSLCKFKSERTNKLNNIAKVGHYFDISVVTLTME